jgi:multisubunit Na+/H+ antiporter MnhG subunit
VIKEVATDALLALATLTVVMASIGIMVMPDAAARLHYVTPAAVVAPVLVTLAIFVKEGLDSNTGMTVIALVFLVAVSPFLGHATLRAIRARSTGERR